MKLAYEAKMEGLSSSFLPKYSQSNLSSLTSAIIDKRALTKVNHQPRTRNILISNIAERIDEFKINKTKSRALLTRLFKSVDDFICNSLDKPLRPSLDPKHVLSGNYTPVDELPPTPCEVVEGGSLPTCLHGGVYLCNGPNPQFFPSRRPYHLFDGDGMIHAVRILSNKDITFCSRYVKTYKYTVERDLGYPVIPSAFSSFNGVAASFARVAVTAARVLAGEFSPAGNGFGTANTSVAVIGRKLYALGESDLPYEIQVTPDGDVTTLSRTDFKHKTSGEKDFLSMTAHPKVDPETGEAFAFRYHVVQPRLTFFRIDAEGRKQPDVEIFSMKNSTGLMHDFAVTENYAIFSDSQLVVSPCQILKGRPPMRVDLDKVPRIGVIPKYAEDDREMWWVDAPGFNLSHAVNAWEEDGGGTLVILAINLKSVDLVFESMDMAQLTLEELRITTVGPNKVLTRRPLSDKVLEMAAINRAYSGKKNRYVYAAIVAPPMKNVGVVKIDLSLCNSDNCIVSSRMYDRGCSSNEPFFVPNNSSGNSEEDDGVLVAYVHDENSKDSKLLVMDAKSPTLETVAAVKLPGRVPTGFHGLFVAQGCLTEV